MAEPVVGRVLVASLHQGIADSLPMRLAFYEGWLNAEGMREGTIGVAAVSAVLSFLRREGDAYGVVTRRAGEYAAQWTVETMSPLRRRAVRALPAFARRRLVVQMACWMVRESYHASWAVSRFTRGAATVTLRASIFCTVREPVPAPLCGFYASALTALLAAFDLPLGASVVTCRASGDETCLIAVAGAGEGAG